MISIMNILSLQILNKKFKQEVDVTKNSYIYLFFSVKILDEYLIHLKLIFHTKLICLFFKMNHIEKKGNGTIGKSRVQIKYIIY